MLASDQQAALRPNAGAFGRYDVLIVIAIFMVSRLIYGVSGVTFDATTLQPFIQFIDRELLTDRLLESLWYYHANPPLLNLATGVALKMFGPNHPLALAVLFHALGILLALATWRVIDALSGSRITAHVLTALMVISPAFVLYENWLMYTFPATVMLGVAAFLLLRYVESGATRFCVAFFVVIALLALTRSVFHLVWAIVITAGLAAFMRQHAKQVLLCAVLPLLAIAGWYGKNHVMFGAFSASTWLGLGLSNITTLTVSKDELGPLVDDGTLSSFALVSRYEETDLLFQTPPQSDAANVPVLHRRTKSTGEYNFNYQGLIGVSQAYTRDSLRTARLFPSNYAQGVRLANRLFFSPSSMNRYFSLENRIAASPIEMIYNPLLYGANVLPNRTEQPHFGYTGKYSLEVNTGLLLVIVFPMLFAYAVIRVGRGVLGPPGKSRYKTAVAAFIAFNMLYIYVLGTLLELAENYRYRFLMEPLFWMLVGLAAGDLWRLRAARKDLVLNPKKH